MPQGSTAHEDASLALRASEGDAAAFGGIVRRYQARLVRLCCRYVGPGDAEDVAQEAFVRAFVNIKRFDASRPLAPWLLTIARRLCIDRLRQRAVRPAGDSEPELVPTAPTAEADAHSREMVALLGRTLAELPEGQREAIVLFHVEGLAYKDIASVLEVPLGTVMTWLHRGRALLKEKLGGERALRTATGGVES